MNLVLFSRLRNRTRRISRFHGVFLLLFCSGIANFPLWSGQEKKISLTFDHLPAVAPFGYWRPREVSSTILRVLESHDIKAAGFVVEEKIDDDPSTYIVLEDWALRGHILGNQTYSNVDLNQLNTEDFLHHVVDGQKYLRRVSRVHRFSFRYLRFPYLHEGDTQRKKREVAKILYNNGYTVAPVTVKTSDHLFNEPYLANERTDGGIRRLKAIYLEHVGKSLEYAENQSVKIFSCNISHILQLHCGLATAHFLDDLIEMLKRRGYEFISFTEALSDPAFQTEENYAGSFGLSFIDRVAATNGYSFDEKHGELTREEIEKRLITH